MLDSKVDYDAFAGDGPPDGEPNQEICPPQYIEPSVRAEMVRSATTVALVNTDGDPAGDALRKSAREFLDAHFKAYKPAIQPAAQPMHHGPNLDLAYTRPMVK